MFEHDLTMEQKRMVIEIAGKTGFRFDRWEKYCQTFGVEWLVIPAWTSSERIGRFCRDSDRGLGRGDVHRRRERGKHAMLSGGNAGLDQIDVTDPVQFQGALDAFLNRNRLRFNTESEFRASNVPLFASICHMEDGILVPCSGFDREEMRQARESRNRRMEERNDTQAIGRGKNLDPVNSRDVYGRNLLHYAVQNRDKRTVSLIMDHVRDVDARDHYGDTALHIGLRVDHPGIIGQLLRHGADPCMHDEENGYDAFRLARAHGCCGETVSLLSDNETSLSASHVGYVTGFEGAVAVVDAGASETLRRLVPTQLLVVETENDGELLVGSVTNVRSGEVRLKIIGTVIQEDEDRCRFLRRTGARPEIDAECLVVEDHDLGTLLEAMKRGS